MKSVMIRLSLVENVNKFVNVVSRYPFEMDLRAGRQSWTQNQSSGFSPWI